MPRAFKIQKEGKSSRYACVSFQSGRYHARFRHEGVVYNLGYWVSERDAAVARDRAFLFFGIEAPLNLPARSRKLGPASPDELRRLARESAPLEPGKGRRKPLEDGVRRRAALRVNGELHDLGAWPTREQMEIARDRAVLHFRLEDRRLWRPEASRKLGPASPEELRRESVNAYKVATATSRYWGVTYQPKKDRWLALLGLTFIGAFPTEIEAAEAVDRFALHCGEAPRNFPGKRLRPASIEELRKERRARRPGTPSAYAGVEWLPEHRRERPWIFRVTVRGKSLLGGGYADQRSAAIARDRAIMHYELDVPLACPEESKALGPASIRQLRDEVRASFKKKTSSRYHGVHFDKRSQRYVATIVEKGEFHYLGAFEVEEEAAAAWDEAVLRLRGPTARRNFVD